MLLSGFCRSVPYAALLLIVTPGIPVLDSPTQSVLRNSGDERMNMFCRLNSSYLSRSARFSRIGEP